MGKSKERREYEEYEEYWKMTAAWTDIYGSKFNMALRITLRFIDKNLDELLKHASLDLFKNSKLYDKLQDEIVYAFGWKGKDPGANARKGINTFVKLGFINPFLAGYNPLSKKFINTNSKEEKCIFFSKIFYENASFASSVVKDCRDEKHLAFLLRTLDKNKTLTKEEIKALMITNISQFPKGYLNKDELKMQIRESEVIDFEERKYNQISHLMSFLKAFADLHYVKSEEKIYFEDDPDIVEDEYNEKFHCDPIKLRIHRDELLAESRRLYGGKEICYLEKKPYKALRDSHIKGKQECIDTGKEEEAYDVNNALLLSPNIDAYFDKHDISFTDDGKVLVGKAVKDEIRFEIECLKLDAKVLNKERKKYLAYHRALFIKRNGDIN